MSRSKKLAAGILAVLVLFFTVGTILRGDNGARNEVPVTTADTVPTLDKVVPEKRSPRDGGRVLVRNSQAERRPIFLNLKGRSEPARTVSVRSETTGVVVSANAQEGQTIEVGQVLCALDVEGRQAKVDEALATVASAELDYKAAADLVEKGWKPPNQKAAARAKLDAARAALQSARVELSKTRITAPFSGVFETRSAEVGDFLAPGGACGVMLDLDPLIIAADISERYAGVLVVDSPAKAVLGGRTDAEIPGKVRYVASSSDAITRTYRVEIALDNPGMALPAGISTEVRIQIGEGVAHHITPALIVYADDGAPGVRYVGVGGVVHMAPVDIVDSDQDGVWVTGLPEIAQIIVEGQEYVREGLRVEPVVDEEST